MKNFAKSHKFIPAFLLFSLSTWLPAFSQENTPFIEKTVELKNETSIEQKQISKDLIKDSYTLSRISAKTLVKSKAELIKKIQSAKSGDVIYLEGGVDYGDLTQAGKGLIQNVSNITIMTQPGSATKAIIKGLRIHNSSNIKISNIKFLPSKEKPAIECTSTDNLTITGNEISGGKDGILVRGRYIFDKSGKKVLRTENVQNIRISNNILTGIQRDGIHVKQGTGVFISDNQIGSFHPNYEGMTLEEVAKSEKISVNNGVENRDHSDCIQVTDSSKIYIAKNNLDAGNGAWNQGIFVKMENNQINSDWIKVENNSLSNDHPWGIRIHGFTKANEEIIKKNNTLRRVETIGSIPDNHHTPTVKVD